MQKKTIECCSDFKNFLERALKSVIGKFLMFRLFITFISPLF